MLAGIIFQTDTSIYRNMARKMLQYSKITVIL